MSDFKLWTLLFLCIAIQGFFLSFLIASRKHSGNKKANLFLSAFIALFSVILLFWVGHWNELFDQYDIHTFIYRPIPLLLGPLLFYYVKSFFDNITGKDLVHLTPFLMLVLYFFPAYWHFNEAGNPYETLWNWEICGAIVLSLNTASILFYTAFLHNFCQAKYVESNRKEGTMKVIRLMIVFFGIFSFTALINFWIRMTLPNHPIFFDLVLSTLISVFIYCIGYLGFNSPTLILAFEKTFDRKYSSSGLKAGDADQLLFTLISHLEQHRPYLSEDYKIGQLASETNISSHHISELLNKYLKKNFSTVINEYRIEEAKKILIADDFRYKKIASVGFEVGFSSPSTFYSWFKKLTGTSPAQFLKDAKD